MDQNSLEVGAIYFGVSYEDEDIFLRPVISSFEYLGEDEKRPSIHHFQFLGTGDLLELTERNLDYIVDLDGLKQTLDDWRERYRVRGNT